MKRGTCERCGTSGVWVNKCIWTERRMPIPQEGQLCGDCFDVVNVSNSRTEVPLLGADSGPNHNDPSFDNVIQAMEEDR